MADEKTPAMEAAENAWTEAQASEAQALENVRLAHVAVKEGATRLKTAKAKLAKLRRQHLEQVAEGKAGSRDKVREAEGESQNWRLR